MSDYNPKLVPGSVEQIANANNLGSALPPVSRFAELAALKPNWDSYHAPEIDKAALQRAQDWLSAVNVVPCSDGGVQLEWHKDGVELEIVFNADGKIDVLFATENAQRTAVRHVQF